MLLFFVMDPLGNAPLFLVALRHVDADRYRAVILRELAIALGILVAFLFTGRYVLGVLHVSRAALTAGGGFVLVVIALRMVFPTADRPPHEQVPDEPFVVPLAVPYTVGPSMLATELLFMTREPHRWPVWLGTVCLAWLASAVILREHPARRARRARAHRGRAAHGHAARVVGIEMLLAGIAEYFRR